MGYRKAGIKLTLKSRDDSGFVFFIHGLFMTYHCMLPLAFRLRCHGFTGICYDYPTRILTVEEHGHFLAEELSRLPDSLRPLHVVTHSMGGLLIRSALSQRPELCDRVSRIVMITPPNQGSDLASYWFQQRWTHSVIVPLEDMRSEPDSRIHSLPEPPMDVGVIAAQYDGAVRMPYTFLRKEADRVVFPVGHTSILFRKETAAATESFLRTGSFSAN